MLTQLPLAADERRRRAPAGSASTVRVARGPRRTSSAGILSEDRVLEAPQRRSRLDPERPHKRLPRRP